MTGYIRWLRQLLGPPLIPLAYVTAIVRDGQGRVLFQRRADFRDQWWGLPGGALEPGETAEDCLRREVAEETGLAVEPERLTGVYSSPRYLITYPNGDRAQQVSACYECRLVGGELRPDDDEVLDSAFFRLDELPPRPAWYADMLAHALAGRDAPYFDPPEARRLDTPYPDLPAVRRAVGPAPLVWPGAAALVLDDRGRVLLQRRADFGLWGWPAGALHVGESAAWTAMRETREETGLEVEPVRLLQVYAGREVVYPNGHRLFPFGQLFACRLTGGDLRPDGQEALEAGFFDPGDLPPLHPLLDAPLRAVLARGPFALGL